MPTQRDYYSVLQVNPAASQSAIDAAYARLSRIYDPAVSRKRKASLRKQELDDAYAVLSDRRRRAEYDRLRARGLRPHEMPPLEPERGVSARRLLAWLSNPYVFSGLAASGVLTMLIAIVLISVLGGGGTENAASQLTPAGSTPTLPAQTPSTAPATPPPVAGQPVTTASGLQYVDIQPGSGASPATGDTAVVNYTGWLQADGTKFDSSVERPQPFSFHLGKSEVIKAWDEGVATMQVGGTRRLIVPPDLGYGASGFPPKIPANATLIFDIELLDVFPAPSPSPAPAAEPTATMAPPSPTQ